VACEAAGLDVEGARLIRLGGRGRTFGSCLLHLGHYKLAAFTALNSVAFAIFSRFWSCRSGRPAKRWLA
jgi:hypothetical protein